MDEQRGPRRRRGRRGGKNRQSQGSQPPQPPQPASEQNAPPRTGGTVHRAPQPDTRPAPAGGQEPRARRDYRRGPGGPGGPGGPAPAQPPPPQQKDERPRRGDGRPPRDRDRRPSRDGRDGRDARPRVFETPVPQDEASVALGARFREAQMAVRDARKTLDRRRADQGDEPEWLQEQYAEAERLFEEVATEWSDHLAKTGRKVVRR
ncbi:MAG: hypothetical protein WEC75_02610 [Dehalococcoidia bacterium]